MLVQQLSETVDRASRSSRSDQRQIVDPTTILRRFIRRRNAHITPIPSNDSLDLQSLRQSEKPEQRSLADMVSALSDLRSGLSAVEERLAVNSDEEGSGRHIQLLVQQLSETVDRASRSSRSDQRQIVDPTTILRMTRALQTGRYIYMTLPVLVGSLREYAPWLYELGIKLYEQLEDADWAEARETTSRLMHMNRLSREVVEVRPELRMVATELTRFLDFLWTRLSPAPDDDDDLPW